MGSLATPSTMSCKATPCCELDNLLAHAIVVMWYVSTSGMYQHHDEWEGILVVYGLRKQHAVQRSSSSSLSLVPSVAILPP
jgi:hypothetical protein